MASLKSKYPGTGEYLEKLSSIAFLPASLICSGVSKSGSPTLMLMTLIPCAFISLLFCDIASVADGASLSKRSDSCAIVNFYFMKNDFK